MVTEVLKNDRILVPKKACKHWDFSDQKNTFHE